MLLNTYLSVFRFLNYGNHACQCASVLHLTRMDYELCSVGLCVFSSGLRTGPSHVSQHMSYVRINNLSHVLLSRTDQSTPLISPLSFLHKMTLQIMVRCNLKTYIRLFIFNQIHMYFDVHLK